MERMNKLKRIAVCPGSFDPITFGHIDIIKRASQLFDEVVVLISVNTVKSPSFTESERMMMIKKNTSEFGNVVIDVLDGLLADYVKKIGAVAIVKGLRAVSDFEYEFQMALLNKALNPEYETMFMMTNTKYSYISSSMVKELAGFHGDLTGLVPCEIIETIEEKYK